MLFSNMSHACIPFSSSSPSLLLLHLHFLPPVARHPSSRVALWLYLSPFLPSARRPSLSISDCLAFVCAQMCAYGRMNACVCLCAAANSLPLSRKTANCCCCKEYSSPLLLLFHSPPPERMICMILLEQMVACVCQPAYGCIFLSPSIYRLLCLSLTGLNDSWLLGEALN